MLFCLQTLADIEFLKLCFLTESTHSSLDQMTVKPVSYFIKTAKYVGNLDASMFFSMLHKLPTDIDKLAWKKHTGFVTMNFKILHIPQSLELWRFSKIIHSFRS